MMEQLEGCEQGSNIASMEIDCSSERVESDSIAEVRRGVIVDVDLQVKVVTSRVTKHFHLLRIEGTEISIF